MATNHTGYEVIPLLPAAGGGGGGPGGAKRPAHLGPSFVASLVVLTAVLLGAMAGVMDYSEEAQVVNHVDHVR